MESVTGSLPSDHGEEAASFGSEETIRTVAVAVGTGFQKASVRFTVTGKSAPANSVDGLLMTPRVRLPLPGWTVSPGRTIWTCEAGAAVTVKVDTYCVKATALVSVSTA